VVHVLDASRAVSVVSELRDPGKRKALDARNRAEQADLRDLHGKKRVKPLQPYAVVNARRLELTFRPEDLTRPEFLGRRFLDEVPLDEIARYIDWTFFFTAWELPGRFPQILEHPEYGEAARDLYESGLRLLRRIVDDCPLHARAAYGFWPAAAEGNDVVLYTDEARATEACRFHMLRQQAQKAEGEPYLSIADFVAPRTSGLADYVGAFAVTVLGAEELAKSFEANLDDYNSILVKALADRLAEAFAELLHARVRREWGYGREELLSKEGLIAEKYRGIRPAIGYPACPDHSEKRQLFALLDAGHQGISLTESCAMSPAASVSGLYFAHPEARYFNLGKVDRAQAQDYARRKGQPLAEIERWLGPTLGYEPAGGGVAA
jgi:5-methyltetrahydrofolate--homocysteine methyltransferase